MRPAQNWEIEWLVAVLAPWTISPHPNFPTEHDTGASQLALVTEMRDKNERILGDREVDLLVGWQNELVEGARGSTDLSTQLSSTETLVDLAANALLPPGARVAAAIYASVSLCEMELHDQAVATLTTLVYDLQGAAEQDEALSGSQRLIICAALMQLATRQVECCKFENAHETIGRLLNLLPNLRDSELQHFATSSGISWGSSTVQRDLIRSVGNHARSLGSFLETFAGHAWVRVVRSRSSWVDAKMSFRSAHRDEIVLRDVFERRIEADSNTRYHGRISAEGAGYQALIIAELSGHFGVINGERESLGKILILERSDNPERVREALRLLRQGRATKALQSAIAWIRAQGPSQALTDDALVVANRAVQAGWCSEQDLLILEGASDFLSPDERDLAISAALIFEKTPQIQGRASWSSWERLWKTLVRLVPGSRRHNEIAERAYDYVSRQGELSHPVMNTLVRLLEAFDWDEIDASTRESWGEWSERSERNAEDLPLSDVIRRLLGRERSLQSIDESALDQGARLANEGLRDHESEEDIAVVGGQLEALLQDEMTQALQGSMSFGGYQLLNVAVAYALRFPSDSLWTAIIAHLCHPVVDAALKDDATDRLTDNVGRLPATVLEALRANIDPLLETRRRGGMFGGPGDSFFFEGFRLAAAIGALEKSDMLRTVLRLSASDVRGRTQAARAIPHCIGVEDATWGQALLLQLSHDRDPSVRAATGHSLVQSLGIDGELKGAVISRIVDFLESDGITVPLAVLHEIQRRSSSMREQLTPLIAAIEARAAVDGNYVVQGAAKLCVEMLASRVVR